MFQTQLPAITYRRLEPNTYELATEQQAVVTYINPN